jgi:hypothetical protein
MPEFATRSARPLPAPAAPPTGRWLAALRRGLDALVAFATLRDAELDGDRSVARASVSAAPGSRAHAPRTSSAAAGESHPHRRPLRGPARSRRPGTVAAAPQACLTPLTPKRLPRRRDPVADAHR